MWAVLAAWCCTPWYPEPMPVNRSTTRRLTVNLSVDVAGGVEQIALARGLSSSALAGPATGRRRPIAQATAGARPMTPGPGRSMS